MKTKLFLLIVLFAFNTHSFAKKVTQTTTVHFKTTEYLLGELAKKQLDKLITKSKSDSDYEIFIEGHTDDRGSQAYNNQLSLNRSQAVKTYLVENGIDKKRIVLNFRGELDPKVPNSSNQNQGLNRRVEVSYTSYEFESLTELEQALSPEIKQNIVVDPSQESFIVGKNGIIVLIAPNSFCNQEGEMLSEKVEIELTEALEFKDFVSAGLETRSNDQLLETGGMFKLSAKTASGEEVNLLEGKQVLVSVPDQNRKKNMEVFVSDSGQNWLPTNKAITNRPDFSVLGPYPVMRGVQSQLPKFVYPVEKPQKPKSPSCPVYPHAPQKKNYARPIPWYRLAKAQIRQGQEENYLAAMDRFEKKLERYERKEASYENRVRRFENDMLCYKEKLSIWEQNKEAAAKKFKKTTEYLVAVKEHQAKYELSRKVYEKKVQDWRAKRSEIAGEWGENIELFGSVNKDVLNSYVFEINQLGWINCDRFYSIPSSEKQDVILATEDVENEKVLVLFKNRNSMINCYPNSERNEFTINSLPKKEETYIFAYKLVDQKPHLCYMAMDGSRDYELNYTESSFSEIKDILAQFGNN